MLIVHVHIRVRPDDIDAFRAATLENARNSVQEPGVVRFDVLQQAELRRVLKNGAQLRTRRLSSSPSRGD